MADQLEILKELADLAHGQMSDTDRRDLLRRVSDVFLMSPDTYSDKQSRYFGDIMESLAYDMEIEMREELARRMSDADHLPHALAKRLASDEISVAGPMLAASPVLSEDDLIEVSEGGSQDHLLAITKRTDIGSRLSAVLVHHGSDSVVDHLVRNDTASIAEETLEKVAERASQSETLQSALIDRHAVPRQILLAMVDHVSERLRQSLVEQLSTSGKDALDDIVGTMKSKIETQEATRTERDIEKLVRQEALNEQMLLRFVFDEKPMEFRLAIGAYLDLEQHTVGRILSDDTGRALAVACRAAGLSAGAFKEIALCKMSSIPSNMRTVMPLVRIYQRLSAANAQRAMRYWRTRNFVGRSGEDRRSGTDTRSSEEKLRMGERRSGGERRVMKI